MKKRIFMMNKAKGNWLFKIDKRNILGVIISWEVNVKR